MRPFWIMGDLNSNDRVLINGIQRRRPPDHRGRDETDVATNQGNRGAPGATGSWERQERILLWSL